jgi:hypothetical protein
MRKKIYFIVTAMAIALVFQNCKDDDTVGGDQSSLGEVGNRFSIGYTTPGVIINTSAQVMDLTDGVSSVQAYGTLIDNNLKDIANDLYAQYGEYYQDIVDYNPQTGKVSATVKLKFTDEGIAVYDVNDEPMTLAKFDAKVGDKYTLEEPNFGEINATVTRVSKEDDFEYKGGPYLYIKTISLEGTASNFPYAKKINYEVNHKFGIVYAKMLLQDGTSYESYFYSQNIND